MMERSIHFTSARLACAFALSILTCCSANLVANEVELMPDGPLYGTPFAPTTFNCTVPVAHNEFVLRLLDHDWIIAKAINGSIPVQLTNSDLYVVDLVISLDYATYVLQIRQVDVYTHGTYSCDLSDSKGLVDSKRINIIDPSLLPQTWFNGTSMFNFTACCVEKDVVEECLPICGTNGVETAISTLENNMEVCSMDYSKLLTCGLAQRNHVRCCSRQLVMGVCLDLCMPENNLLHFDHINCVSGQNSSMRQVLHCITEGQVTIPPPPSDFAAFALETGFLFTWSNYSILSGNDARQDELITGYSLHYKWEVEQSADFQSIVLKGASNSRYFLNANMNLAVTAYVQALSRHGTSLPSNQIMVAPNNMWNLSTSSNNSYSIKECCERHDVSDTCTALLCDGVPKSLALPDLRQCTEFTNVVLKCFAGERNHVPCCLAAQVQPSCLRFCAPHDDLDIQSDDVICFFTQMAPIVSCFDRGLHTVPSAPHQFVLSQVWDVGFNVRWRSPLYNADRVTHYKLFWRNRLNLLEGSVVLSSSVFQYTVSFLDPTSFYEVWAVAYGTEGSSLPTPVLRLVTQDYPSNKITLVPTEPTVVDTLSCCRDAGVPQICQQYCILDPGSTLPDLIPPSCRDVLPGSVTKCLVDGRNHTACCERKFISMQSCSAVCSGDFLFKEDFENDNKTVTTEICFLQNFTTIRDCLLEGHKILPSPPQNFHVSKWGSEFANVNWAAPASYPTGVIGYRLYCQIYGSPSIVTYELNATEHRFHFFDLKPNVQYVFWVVSYTEAGATSLPSNRVNLWTLPSLPTNWSKTTKDQWNYENVSHCCRIHGVAPQCMKFCAFESSDSVGSFNVLDFASCSADFPRIAYCSADSRNHEPCCEKRRVSKNCLHICSGHFNKENNYSLVCSFQYLRIRACFLEGYASAPKPPVVREFSAVSESQVKLLFEKQEYNNSSHEPTRYFAYYRKTRSSTVHWQALLNVTSPLIISNLQSSTSYDLFMLAANSSGVSQPSPVYSAVTYQVAHFQVTLVATPMLLTWESNKETELKCRADTTLSGARYTFEWYHDGVKVSSHTPLPHGHATSILRWPSGIHKDDAGSYSCVVTEEKLRTVTRSLLLQVQFKLRVSTSTPILAGQVGTEAVLRCAYEGWPTHIWWIDSHDRTHAHGLFFAEGVMEVTNWVDNHVTLSQLTILKVNSAHFGTYSCHSENHFGEAHAFVHFYDVTSGPPPILATPAPPLAPTNMSLSNCCRQRDVRTACMPACRLSLDDTSFLDTLLQAHTACMLDYNAIVACLANDLDNSQCCANNQVPAMCHVLCDGRPLDLSLPNRLQCFMKRYLNVIVDCAVKSLPHPSSPRYLHLYPNKTHAIIENSIHLDWNPPEHNAASVVNYEIQWFDVHKQINGSVLGHPPFLLFNLQPATSYNIRVRAITQSNIHGPYSVPLSAATQSRPTVPVHVLVILTGHAQVNVKISWSQSSDTHIAVERYKAFAYVKDKPLKAFNKSVDTTSMEAIFECLQPNSQYAFYVVAINANGLSEPSAEVTLHTGDSTNSDCTYVEEPDSSATENESAHLSVVLAIFIFFCITTALVIVAYVVLNHWNKVGLPSRLHSVPFLLRLTRSFGNSSNSAMAYRAGLDEVQLPTDFPNPVHFDSAPNYEFTDSSAPRAVGLVNMSTEDTEA